MYCLLSSLLTGSLAHISNPGYYCQYVGLTIQAMDGESPVHDVIGLRKDVANCIDNLSPAGCDYNVLTHPISQDLSLDWLHTNLQDLKEILVGYRASSDLFPLTSIVIKSPSNSHHYVLTWRRKAYQSNK